MSITFGNTTVATVSEYTASIVRNKTQAAIEAAKIITDDQLAVKYKTVFDQIDIAADSTKYSYTAQVNEAQRVELVPLLEKLGFKVTETTIVSALAGTGIGTLQNIASVVNNTAGRTLGAVKYNYATTQLTISWN